MLRFNPVRFVPGGREEGPASTSRADANPTSDSGAAAFYEQTLKEKSEGKKAPVRRVSVRLKHRNEPKVPKHSRHAFFKAAQEGEQSVLEQCLAQGFGVSDEDDFGWSLLSCAAYAGHVETVTWLLSKGADPTAVTRRGRTAEDLAVSRGYFEVVAVLRGLAEREEEERTAEREATWCEPCQRLYKDCGHPTSTAHLVAVLPKPKDRASYVIRGDNKGYAMMLREGWDEERGGLGPQGSGRRYPIPTMLKADRCGLGHGKQPKRVTHFKAGDAAAVERTSVPVSSVRLQSRRQRDAVERRERAIAVTFRRQFHEEE